MSSVLHHLVCFRIGGENLAVAQNTYAVAWFKEKEINMVFGLLLSVARLVSVCVVCVCVMSPSPCRVAQLI